MVKRASSATIQTNNNNILAHNSLSVVSRFNERKLSLSSS